MEIRKEAVVDSVDAGYTTGTSLEGVKKSTKNISQNNVFFRHLSREIPATKQSTTIRILLIYTISKVKYQRDCLRFVLMYK
jgi:hypothetical protein